MQELLEAVKLSLGIKHSKKDEDITAAITAAMRELNISGVYTIEEDDLTMQAIKLYCRYWYNYQGEGERYRKHFEALRDTMAFCHEYNGSDLQ